jgi:Domain of unknown function (DUF4111)/Nucleotidyltransferase domain
MHQVLGCPEAVAERLAGDLADRAGDQVLAVYLHGSAALGGWVRGRSDVDVLIVTADVTDDASADSMVQAVVAAGLVCQEPGLETSIVTASAARQPGPPWPFLRHVVAGPAGPARVVGPGEAAAGDRDLLMHYAVCHAAGLRVLGRPPTELIGPIPRGEILAYLADELAWGLASATESYAVLNACRAHAYWSDGAIIAKIAGGETALRRGTGPANVITRALAQQRGEQSDRRPAPDAIEFVQATAALLRGRTGA